MKKKKNTITFIIECGIFILLGVIAGILITNQTNNKPKDEKHNEEKQVQKEKKEEVKEEIGPTNNEILNSVIGEWGMCTDEDCRGITISKEDNDKYTFTPYIMWSDGFDSGEIQELIKIENNVYSFKVYYKGFSNEIGSAPERTIEYKINIGELDSKNLYVEGKKYQKIEGNRESFFQSLIG